MPHLDRTEKKRKERIKDTKQQKKKVNIRQLSKLASKKIKDKNCQEVMLIPIIKVKEKIFEIYKIRLSERFPMKKGKRKYVIKEMARIDLLDDKDFEKFPKIPIDKHRLIMQRAKTWLSSAGFSEEKIFELKIEYKYKYYYLYAYCLLSHIDEHGTNHFQLFYSPIFKSEKINCKNPRDLWVVDFTELPILPMVKTEQPLKLKKVLKSVLKVAGILAIILLTGGSVVYSFQTWPAYWVIVGLLIIFMLNQSIYDYIRS